MDEGRLPEDFGGAALLAFPLAPAGRSGAGPDDTPVRPVSSAGAVSLPASLQPHDTPCAASAPCESPRPAPGAPRATLRRASSASVLARGSPSAQGSGKETATASAIARWPAPPPPPASPRRGAIHRARAGPRGGRQSSSLSKKPVRRSPRRRTSRFSSGVLLRSRDLRPSSPRPRRPSPGNRGARVTSPAANPLMTPFPSPGASEQRHLWGEAELAEAGGVDGLQGVLLGGHGERSAVAQPLQRISHHLVRQRRVVGVLAQVG